MNIKFDKNNIKEITEINDSLEFNSIPAKKRHTAFWIFTIICILATPLFALYNLDYRGYFAFGGEWLILLFPIIVYLLKDISKELKELFLIRKETEK